MKKLLLYSIFTIVASLPLVVFAQPANDVCNNAASITLATPTACASGSTSGFNQGATTTLTNQTNVGATSTLPYPYLYTCGINISSPPKDVWYSFVATGYQTTITVSGATGTLTNPTITMWTGTCANLVGMGCFNGSAGAATLTVYQTIIGQTYYIQIAGRDSTQAGTFTLGVACANNCAGCVLQSFITANPLPINGTYNPGQTVEFCYTVTNWDEGNANWLHGITLTYGAGWDPASLVIDSTPPSCTVAAGSAWSYYPAGQTSSATGTFWGAGFYYETAAGATSGVLDGDPGNNYGDVQAGQGTCSPTFCISLTAFANDSAGSDLNVHFYPSGDGESGSWTSQACAIDPTVTMYNNSSCAAPRLSHLDAACNQSNGIDTARAVGNYPPYIFHWSTGQTDTSNTISIIRNLPPGIYTLTVTNSVHCVIIVRDTIASGARPSGGPDQFLSCPSVVDSVRMSAVGNGIWSQQPGNPAVVNIHHPDSANTTISGFTALGTYYFVWRIDSCTDTVAVIVNSRPNAGPDIFTCVNGTATMGASGSGTWSAQSGNPAATVIANPTSPNTTITGFTVGGTYNFIWTQSTCTDTVSVIIPTFTVHATGDTSLCKYLTTTLSVTASPAALGPFTYLWLDSTLVQSPHAATTLINPLQNTNGFVVRVTSASGCVLTDTVNVILSGVGPRISITPSNNNVCPGDTITLSSTVLVANLVSCGLVDTCPDNTLLGSGTVGTGGNQTSFEGPYSAFYPAAKTQYLFTAAELNAAGISSGAITDISFFVTQLNSTVGYDNFTVSMGCTNQSTLTGFINTVMETAPPTQIFPNLGWSPHPFTHFYNWDGVSNLVVQVCYTMSNNTNNNSDNIAFTAAPAGSVAYSRPFTNATNGCSLTNPSFTTLRPNIKFGTCAPNILQYQWSPPTALCDNCPVTQVVVTKDSTYRLTVNDNGCINDSTVRVTINPYIAINATPDTSLCNHDTVQLNVTLTNPPPASCLQNYFVSSVPYSAIAGGATTIPTNSYASPFGGTSTDDGAAGPFNLGFTIPFYCESVSQVWVSTNGWISFQNPYPATTGTLQYVAQTFPPTAGFLNPQKEVAFAVGDYGVSSTSTASYFVSGTGPNRIFVVKYNNLTALNGSGSATGEMHIYEGSGIIEVMINSLTYGTANHTTGIKDSTGIGVAAPGRNNVPYTVSTPEGWRFTPQNGPSVYALNTFWTPNVSLSNDSIINPRAYPSSSQDYVANVDLVINQFTAPEICRVTDTVHVRAGSFPYSLSATPSTICTGTNSQLLFSTPNTVTNYTWTPGTPYLNDPSISNPVAIVNDSTVFHVTATDANHCTVSDSILVAVYPYPHLTLGRDTTVCYTDSVRLSLAGSYSSYEWYAVGNPTPVSTAPIITAHALSSYVLRLHDAVTGCFFNTDTITIDSFAHPLLHVTPNGPVNFCTGGNVVLSTDQGYNNYNWSPGGGSGTDLPVTTTGNYSYTASDAHNCYRISDTAHVVVSDPTVITVPTTAGICAGDTATVVATTTPPGVSVYWTLSGTTVSTTNVLQTNVPGTYQVQVTTGCPDSAQTVVSAAPAVTLGPVTPVSVCNCNPDILLQPVLTSTGNGNVTYTWSDGSTGGTFTVDSVGTRTYTVTATSADGCTATVSFPVSVTCFKVHPYAVPDTVFAGASFLLADSSGHVGATYQWTPADSLSTPTAASTKGIAAGGQPLDTFYVIATDNATGCSDTASIVITVIDHTGFRMATGFTPNGDGKNDKMYPVTLPGATVKQFRIYNRWGQLVYDNPNAPGWDGGYGGNAQATDTYTYFVTVELPDPSDASKKITQSAEGSFQLFR